MNHPIRGKHDRYEIPLSAWEEGEELDRLSVYDYEVSVSASFNGKEYTAYGLYSCGELVEVYDVDEV